MVFEEYGEDLGRLSQPQLADRAGGLYERFSSRVPELRNGFSELREVGGSFQQFVDLNDAFTNALRDAHNAARYYAEARRKALEQREDMALQLYETRLEDIAREHASLADSWNELLQKASEQDIFLPGGALLLAEKAKAIVEQSLPQIQQTIERLMNEARTSLAGVTRLPSDGERRALELNFRAVTVECQEGQNLARSAAVDAKEGSRAKVEAERLIGEFEAFLELLAEAYGNAERNQLLPPENNNNGNG